MRNLHCDCGKVYQLETKVSVAPDQYLAPTNFDPDKLVSDDQDFSAILNTKCIGCVNRNHEGCMWSFQPDLCTSSYTRREKPEVLTPPDLAPDPDIAWGGGHGIASMDADLAVDFCHKRIVDLQRQLVAALARPAPKPQPDFCANCARPCPAPNWPVPRAVAEERILAARDVQASLEKQNSHHGEQGIAAHNSGSYAGHVTDLRILLGNEFPHEKAQIDAMLRGEPPVVDRREAERRGGSG